jgi:hypothetical protein
VCKTARCDLIAADFCSLRELQKLARALVPQLREARILWKPSGAFTGELCE